MNFKSIRLVFSLVALAGVLGVVTYIRQENYVPVQGVVVSATTHCYVVERNADRKRSKYRHRINRSCRQLDNSASLDRRYDKRYRGSYTYKYVSPVDGSRHYGEKKREGMRHPKRPNVGDRIKVHAHRSKPSHSL